MKSHCKHNQLGPLLSNKQSVITQFLAVGYDNKNSAYRTGLSKKTIEFQWHRIFDKFGVKIRSEAVFDATDHKMINATSVHSAREVSILNIQLH